VGTDITTLCGETHNDSDACLYVKAEKWKLAGYLGNLSQNSALCCDVLFLFMLLGVRVSSTMIYEKKKRRKKEKKASNLYSVGCHSFHCKLLASLELRPMVWYSPIKPD